MRIATWNVQHGRRPDGEVDVALVARCCVALGADVLGLQEVDVGTARSGLTDLPAEVGRATGMAWAFAPAITLKGGGRYGNALLVRGSIIDLDVLELPGRGEPRVALLARAEVDGAGLSVACCHLGLAGVAEEQLPVVTAALADRPPPRMLLGDLNLPPERIDVAGLDLVDRGGPTFPAFRPRVRIDHVALAGLLPDAVVVPELPVSDHRPLVVEVDPP